MPYCVLLQIAPSQHIDTTSHCSLRTCHRSGQNQRVLALFRTQSALAVQAKSVTVHGGRETCGFPYPRCAYKGCWSARWTLSSGRDSDHSGGHYQPGRLGMSCPCVIRNGRPHGFQPDPWCAYVAGRYAWQRTNSAPRRRASAFTGMVLWCRSASTSGRASAACWGLRCPRLPR